MRIRESLVDVDQLALDSSNELGGTAVFFDFENIILGIHESFKVKKIIDHLTERGEVMVRRSYADWGRYRQYQRQFLEEGVQMVFLPSYGTSDKNRTDTAICVDAMEILFRREHIDTFVICSGDSDFGVLAQRLRSYGKRVVGISARSAASQILVKQCHEFIFYESLVGMTMKGYSRDEGEERMKRALVQLVDEYGPRFRASLLKDRMRKHDSTFSEKNYGASNFTRFLKNYSRMVRVLEGGKVEVLWSPEGEVVDSASPRPNQDRPARGANARVNNARPPMVAQPSAPVSDRPSNDRPSNVRSSGDRPSGDRPSGDRPSGARPGSDRPSGARPGSDRPAIDRPPRRTEPPAPAPDRPRSARPPRPPEPSKMTPEVERQTRDLLERAFKHALGDAGSVRMGRIKESLVTLSPGFDEGQLGFRSFASFLKAFPKVVNLDRYRDNVRPVTPEPTPAPVPAASEPTPAPVPAASEPTQPVKAAAKKPAAKKPAAKKPAAKKPAAKKPAAKKPAAKKPAAKKPAAKKPAAKKPAAKKPAAKKPATKKAAAKKTGK